MAISAELLTSFFIFLSKYLLRPTLNKISENIAMIIDGNSVVLEKYIIYLKLVSEPKCFDFFFLKSLNISKKIKNKKRINKNKSAIKIYCNLGSFVVIKF
jgi:hypothetical protein